MFANPRTGVSRPRPFPPIPCGEEGDGHGHHHWEQDRPQIKPARVPAGHTQQFWGLHPPQHDTNKTQEHWKTLNCGLGRSIVDSGGYRVLPGQGINSADADSCPFTLKSVGFPPPPRAVRLHTFRSELSWSLSWVSKTSGVLSDFRRGGEGEITVEQANLVLKWPHVVGAGPGQGLRCGFWK